MEVGTKGWCNVYIHSYYHVLLIGHSLTISDLQHNMLLSLCGLVLLEN